MEMSLAEKQALQVLVEGGAEVATIAFNPNTVIGDPEGDALADGWGQFQAATSANLTEIIFTR